MKKWGNKKTFYKGYSYIEVMIVVGILAVASSLVMPFSFRELSDSRVSYHTKDLASVLFATQQDAYAQIDGSGHGVRFNSDNFDVFDGSSFATATSSYNVMLNYSITFTDIDLTNIATSLSTSEIVFDRGDLKPNAVGSVTMSDGAQTYRIIINQEGMIYYEKI